MSYPDHEHCHPYGGYGIGRLIGRLTIPYYTSPIEPDVPPTDIPDDYTIIPKAFEDQVIATAGKTMDHNILVKAVPYVETSNNSGGLTAYIAAEEV